MLKLHKSKEKTLDATSAEVVPMAASDYVTIVAFPRVNISQVQGSLAIFSIEDHPTKKNAGLHCIPSEIHLSDSPKLTLY
jgi:hypothetical protein